MSDTNEGGGDTATPPVLVHATPPRRFSQRFTKVNLMRVDAAPVTGDGLSRRPSGVRARMRSCSKERMAIPIPTALEPSSSGLEDDGEDDDDYLLRGTKGDAAWSPPPHTPVRRNSAPAPPQGVPSSSRRQDTPMGRTRVVYRRPGMASSARASRPQSRRFHYIWPSRRGPDRSQRAGDKAPTTHKRRCLVHPLYSACSPTC